MQDPFASKRLARRTPNAIGEVGVMLRHERGENIRRGVG